MQDRARLVVIGAGIVGCSTVYHLTRMGWQDIVVLDQGPMFETGGSTSHAPGLVFQTNFARMMTEFSKYAVKLYNELNLDGQPCFYPVGSVEVAYTRERWEDLQRKLGAAKSWNLEATLLSPEETRQKLPLLDPKKIHGSYFVPSDGIAKAVRACEAMARASMEQGAVFHGHTTVTGIEVKNGCVRAVLTSNGRIAAEKVLLCAGIWGPRIGRMAGVPIPLTPMQHQYTRTAPLPELAGETREVVHPIVRHQDYAMYFRQQADRYGIGSYKHEPLLVDPEDLPGWSEARKSPAIMGFTPEHFKAAHAAAVELFPALGRAELTERINGLFSFTPDGFPLIGESLDVRGFWVAEAVWITHGGGVGKAVAEWMAEGTPTLDLREADLNRFPPHALTPSYVKARGAQNYREVYDIIHPAQQMENPRPLRLSPFYPRQKDLGAVFFEGAGWERPQWFEANEALLQGQKTPTRSGWEARYWSPIQAAEHRAARERAVLYDLTPFTQIEVAGPGALAFLQRITANQMDRPVGRVVYTAMLNERGGIHCDLTVVRLGPDRFRVLTGGGSGPHDLAWIRTHLPPDGAVHVTDVTSRSCGLGLWGPKARDILQKVCPEDLSNPAFPYFTARQITVDLVPALALRVSYVGELGWEIYTPTEYGLRLWDTLWEAGQSSGLTALGDGAFDALRLEKGYRLWGADIHADDNPCEAGLDWAVKLDKGDFLGRQALLRIKQQGISRRLCCLTLDDPDAVVLGKEPILDGERVLGYVTSANHGYTAGGYIIYGYLPLPYAAAGKRVEVEYFGRRYAATVRDEPLYDPEGIKLKS
ncbi:MAG: FAD-dependent oxidoreductase [Candidatus Latescibacteria bacterium]|nr:FAD-dependent oxidoreductase [Candidatus Latescibacterota bacterium]